MIIATKIKLKPTKEQEILFWKSTGVAIIILLAFLINFT